ncbi:MAG: phosphoribosylglycinamide formyltransferase [Deltaproteobacteria bacterium]|nr:phosphoribosylglycinamide formyltransferase [Deltaproteobacteria bacterium]
MRLVVLISGSGSNLAALLAACAEGRISGQVVGVVSDRRDAYGLVRAAEAGVPTTLVPWRLMHKAGASREVFDAALAEAVAAYAPDLIVLAGFMRILTPTFLTRFDGLVINLHPSLPGDIIGAGAIERAFEEAQAGRRDHTGVMVHEAIAEVDAGPVLGQVTVPILPDDTLEALKARIHAAEHTLLIDVVARRCAAPSRPSTDPTQVK